MAGVHELTPALGNAAACRAIGLWRGAPARNRARAHGIAFVGPAGGTERPVGVLNRLGDRFGGGKSR
jgi:hypothetical protein